MSVLGVPGGRGAAATCLAQRPFHGAGGPLHLLEAAEPAAVEQAEGRVGGNEAEDVTGPHQQADMLVVHHDMKGR